MMTLKDVQDSLVTIHDWEPYIPETLNIMGIVKTVADCKIAVRNNRITVIKALASRDKPNGRYVIKYIQLTHSNNWLRMHGYPMKKRKNKH